MGFMSSLLSAFTGSGALFMWAIFLLQVVTIALIAERVYVLFFEKKEAQEDLIQGLEKDMARGLPQKATERLKAAEGHSAAARLALSAMDSWNLQASREEIQTRLEESLIHEASEVEKRLSLLPLLANLATLMGLLGTIAGLIGAFMGLGTMTGAEKASFLSKGIALAMNTTAYGLIVAVPTLLAYALLQQRSQKLLQNLNTSALRILVILGFQNAPGLKLIKKTTVNQ
jgi:biopolymer transport protein ExbB/TolQ